MPDPLNLPDDAAYELLAEIDADRDAIEPDFFDDDIEDYGESDRDGGDSPEADWNDDIPEDNDWDDGDEDGLD